MTDAELIEKYLEWNKDGFIEAVCECEHELKTMFTQYYLLGDESLWVKKSAQMIKDCLLEKARRMFV